MLAQLAAARAALASEPGGTGGARAPSTAPWSAARPRPEAPPAAAAWRPVAPAAAAAAGHAPAAPQRWRAAPLPPPSAYAAALAEYATRTPAVRRAVGSALAAGAPAPVLRSGHAALLLHGTPTAFATLPTAGLAEAARWLRFHRAMTKDRVSELRAYEAMFTSRGEAPAYPITAALFGAFVADRSFARQWGAASVETAGSNLKNAAIACGVWGLSDAEDRAKGDEYKAVFAAAPTAPRGAAESERVPLADLAAAVRELRGRGSPASLQTALLIVASTGLQWRGSEGAGKKGARVEDLRTWTRCSCSTAWRPRCARASGCSSRTTARRGTWGASSRTCAPWPRGAPSWPPTPGARATSSASPRPRAT